MMSSTGLGRSSSGAITNCVVNRWGDGPDTPAGVRDRAARADSPSLEDLLARVDDETLALAIRGVPDLVQRWTAVSPGGKVRLSWPLERDFFAGAAEAKPWSTGSGPSQWPVSSFSPRR
jgi:hypothetical protein